jgi:DNA-binding transcriptional MerR regulator
VEIDLEKIDIIRERTGVSYSEAKEALEKADGSLIDALIALEQQKSHHWSNDIEGKSKEIIERLKEIVKKGNVKKIKVKKDDKIIIDLPVNAGALGLLLIPKLTALGAAIALLSKCTIEIEGITKKTINVDDGEIEIK